MAPLLRYAMALAMASQLVLSQRIEVECTPSKKCPDSKPCCSQYGQCGVGAYCLGGCDPKSSTTVDACVPAPVCQSKTFKWDNLDSVAPNTKYLGDASKADWVASGQPLTTGGNLLLTMAPETVGTLLASNHYMWYGKTTARLKTSRGKGVVTAFILLSDVKDEVDFEWIGSNLQDVETNYYFQGITDYSNGDTFKTEDTFNNFHLYEIDWTPEAVKWSIDGKVVRTLERKSTFNATTDQYNYPQSPSRVQLSLWPGGLPSNGEGTIEWAGGLVNWEHPDITNHGYYYATFDEVTIECYDPPANADIKGDTSYIFKDASGTEDTVQMTNKKTVLKSFLGTGVNMTADYPSKSSSSSSSKSPAESSDVAVIPGLTGGGPGTNGQRESEGKNNKDGDGGDGGDDGDGSPTNDWDRPATTGFTQGNVDGPGDSNGASSQNEQMLRGSLFAGLVALTVLVTL
ncbi:hypothetical protein AJ80_09067 [Polytolypa hystricis UAMH7299]|uniref:GH16 domain-containing protein n=1 Tax=Polytolypa hystricis (strain UAMH7299) TaxID=1447883 RepID=A0A2B7WNX7_POLH7|nr:hypothetical protein AJ80_09067 [Polytolypa hystricis UAMH7299]